MAPPDQKRSGRSSAYTRYAMTSTAAQPLNRNSADIVSLRSDAPVARPCVPEGNCEKGDDRRDVEHVEHAARLRGRARRLSERVCQKPVNTIGHALNKFSTS